MRELLLITPGAAQRSPTDAEWPRPPLRLRAARGRGPRPAWRDALALRVGAPELLAEPTASVVARALAAHAAPPAEHWLVSPVRLVAGLDRVYMPADALLELSDPHWQRLCADFARELGGGSLRLTPVAAGAGLLEGAAFGALRTLPPEAGLGRDLRALQPVGVGAARWRALQGEIEMWLHAQPLNRERSAAGVAPVSSLWLWGGPTPVAEAGAATTASTSVAARAAAVREAWQLLGSDPWLAALAALLPRVKHAPAVPPTFAAARAAALAAADDASVAVLLPATLGGVELASAWLEPAHEALAAGSIGRLTLWTPAAEWQLRPGDGWRLWRRARSWQEVLTVIDE